MKPARLILWLVACAAAATVYANDGELDEDLMQNIEDANKSLASNIAQQDIKASVDDAKALQGMFSQVEDHFVHKGGADNAVDLARKSESLTTDIVKSVTAQDFDTAQQTAATLSRTCRTCHTFYKKS